MFSLEIVIDQEVCIGCRACVGVDSEVFGLNDNGKAYVKKGKDKLDETKKRKARKSVDICPVNAISIE